MKKTSSELLLLDVNVLLALAWPNHQFHGPATRRLEKSSGRWATCALTQLGFIRLSSNPGAVSPARTPGDAALLLAELVRDPAHVYLGALPAPISAPSVTWTSVAGHRQVTDAYLLLLARRSGATFLTFDARLKALAAGGDRLELLADL